MPPPTPWNDGEKKTLRQVIKMMQRLREQRTEDDPVRVYEELLSGSGLDRNGVYYRRGTRTHHFVVLLRNLDRKGFKTALQLEAQVQKRFPNQVFDFSVKSADDVSDKEKAGWVADGYRLVE